MRSISNDFSKPYNIKHAFQPIYKLNNYELYGYEALIRSEKFQNPEKLFQHASQIGHIFEIDIMSIYNVFNIIHDKQKQLENMNVFINILPSTMLHPNFQQIMVELSAINQNKLPSIIFEISESEKVTNLKRVKEIIKYIQDHGFKIALDDVGTGDSSMKNLVELQPDILKVDKYFAKDLANSPLKQRVIQSLMSVLCENTILILEGIETSEDYQAAKELGVSYAQGYYFGRPRFF